MRVLVPRNICKEKEPTVKNQQLLNCQWLLLSALPCCLRTSLSRCKFQILYWGKRIPSLVSPRSSFRPHLTQTGRREQNIRLRRKCILAESKARRKRIMFLSLPRQIWCGRFMKTMTPKLQWQDLMRTFYKKELI